MGAEIKVLYSNGFKAVMQELASRFERSTKSPSTTAFAALIQRLGIADDLGAKSKLTATGEEVGHLVVRGEAEFGGSRSVKSCRFVAPSCSAPFPTTRKATSSWWRA